MYCAKDQQLACQCSPLQFLAVNKGGVSAFPNSLKISRIQIAVPSEICLPKRQGLFLYRAKKPRTSRSFGPIFFMDFLQ